MEIVRFGSHFFPDQEPLVRAELAHILAHRVLEIVAPNHKPTLFHGSPIGPEAMGDIIQPHQAKTRIKGALIDHGPRSAVSTSSTLDFPITRSLLHDRHPAFKGSPPFPILSRKANLNGEAYIFTAAEVLRHLHDNEAQGFVYASHHPPDSAAPFVGREDLAEWRVPEPLRWDWVGRTTIDDLPENILVIDSSEEAARTFLDEVPERSEHPFELSRHMGVLVSRLVLWRRDNL